MSEKIDQIARWIADGVYETVLLAHYSREHIARAAQRAAYLRSYHSLSVLDVETSGKSLPADYLRGVAERYDETREAEEKAGLRRAFETAMAKREQARG